MKMITSGYNFEGYHITNYCGFCTGECVLGTGFLSTWESGVADFFGTNSTLYESKLATARASALAQLSRNASQIGGNALIGVDVDYTTFTGDLMGVMATGTAVTIESTNSPANNKYKAPIRRTLFISDYNISTPIRAISVSLEYIEEQTQATLNFISYNDFPVDALQVELTFKSVFGDVQHTIVSDIYDFRKENSTLIATPFYINITPSLSQNIHSVYAKILKYISDDQIYISELECNTAYVIDKTTKNQFGADAVTIYEDTATHWICPCGYHNIVDEESCSLCGRNKAELMSGKASLATILEKVQQFTTVREIKNAVDDTNLFDQSPYADLILKKLEESVYAERLYGNRYHDFVKFLTEIESEDIPGI